MWPTSRAVSAAWKSRAPSAGLSHIDSIRTELGSANSEPIRTDTVSMPCLSQ